MKKPKKVYSFGTKSLSVLLHYSSRSTINFRISRGRFPEPDTYEYFGDTPRWYATTVAKWLSENPDMLRRVTDQRMLEMVSEVDDTIHTE